MKTIAITVDEDTLRAIDELGRSEVGGRRGSAAPNRSAIVRAALRHYVDARQREANEERERRIFAKHRDKLARQAKALVTDQAGP